MLKIKKEVENMCQMCQTSEPYLAGSCCICDYGLPAVQQNLSMSRTYATRRSIRCPSCAVFQLFRYGIFYLMIDRLNMVFSAVVFMAKIPCRIDAILSSWRYLHGTTRLT